MIKPTKLVFTDEATFTLVKGIVWVPLAVIAFGFGLALVTTDATLVDLALPIAVLSFVWLFWVALLAVVAWVRRMGERGAIKRMFAGEIWECWQFRSAEWQVLVESESNLIHPKDEGLKAYVGAVYSAILGAIIAIILVAVGVFVIDDPDTKTAMWIAAIAVFVLLLAIGLFQPVMARYEAYRYHRKALRVSEPHVWFASDGIYDEALGYTSLKDLEKVTDQTRSRKAIQFTLTVSTDTSDSSVAYPFPVPGGYEERAGKLVRRYRQERLGS
jgi:hypothetical protein